nr:hypothetical protein Iba_chr07aCG7520 [Ipomoea batatas]
MLLDKEEANVADEEADALPWKAPGQPSFVICRALPKICPQLSMRAPMTVITTLVPECLRTVVFVYNGHAKVSQPSFLPRYANASTRKKKGRWRSPFTLPPRACRRRIATAEVWLPFCFADGEGRTAKPRRYLTPPSLPTLLYFSREQSSPGDGDGRHQCCCRWSSETVKASLGCHTSPSSLPHDVGEWELLAGVVHCCCRSAAYLRERVGRGLPPLELAIVVATLELKAIAAGVLHCCCW